MRVDAADAAIDWCRYPALATSRAFSKRLAAALRNEFEKLDGDGAPLFIAAAGSLGRLEAHAASDCDLLLAADAPLGPDLRACINDVVAAQGLREAKADGIYTETLQRSTLLDPARRGSLAEPPGDFGRRMAMLLDAAPLSKDARFQQWQRDVVDWYVAAPDGATWQLLIDDLGRYRHAYRCWQRFDQTLPAPSLRQVKLHGSRTIGFAGLLLLTVQAQARGAGGVEWFAGQLARTPLERVVDAMGHCGCDANGLLEAYAAIHGTLCDPHARQCLEGDPAASAAGHLLQGAREHGSTIRGELFRVFSALLDQGGPAAGIDVLF